MSRTPAAALLFALAASLLLLPLWAQTDPPDPFSESDEKYEPPPPAPRDDPGVDEDPLPAEDLSVLGQPLLEGTQEADIAVLDDAPPAGEFTGLAPSQTTTPQDCKGYTGAVTPIQVSANFPHYFSYGAQPILLVGVSADAACHMDLVDADDRPDPFKCRIGNYPALFADLKARRLNKIRLWVALSGHANSNPRNRPGITAREPANQPFLFVNQALPSAPQGQVGYYRMDQKNAAYFDSLRDVVREAKRNDLFVEVTFFAPFEGERSPWLASARRAGAPNPTTGLIEAVGFTDLRWFVLADPPAAANARMHEFQRKVIDWTIDALWCYDNVWWEVANEPEGNDLDPNRVIAWQQQRIAYTKASEARYLRTASTPGRPLQARHPIAVQPFNEEAAKVWRSVPPAGTACTEPTFQHCRPDVVNGHYTQVLSPFATGFPGTQLNRLEVGAIRLIREFGNPMKVFGLNEDNITPLGGPKGTRTLKTDILPITEANRQFGLPDPVRAEAWEFLLHGGGSFDHFGYSYDSDGGRKVRDQLGRIRVFLSGLKVHELLPSMPGAAGAAWADVGPYPIDTSWDPLTLARKHWGATESRNWKMASTGRQFLLYVHRSSPRCKGDNDDFDRQVSGSGEVQFKCAGQNLSFDAYDGRRRPTARYREEGLTLHLGSRMGTFDVSWLDPANPSATPLAQEQIEWKPSPESCKGSSPCKITSPRYPYDIVLRIVQR